MAASKWALEVRGFKDARKSFIELVNAMDPAGKSYGANALYRVAKSEIQTAMRDAGQYARDKARSNAAVSGVPRRLYSGARPAIFSFADFSAARDDKRKRSVLVGVRTGLSVRAKDERLFIAWGEGKRRRKDGTVAKRGLSMSFGALFERGTNDGRIRATHFFQAAIGSTTLRIKQIIGQAYIRAVEILNRNTKT